MNSLLMITALMLIFSSCEKETTDPITDIHITKDITENTTWQAQYVYYVDVSIDVTNAATLTIEPGTTIKFGQGKSLSISYAGSSSGNIKANGTKEKPIVFTSQADVKSKGDWNGIWLYTGANASEFNYCIFEYAGGSGWSGGEGAITINLAKNVSIDNCIFENSESYGVRVYQSRLGLNSFTGNTFNNNEINDLKLYAYNVSHIGEGNIFSKDIDVFSSDVDAPGDVVWAKQNANYILFGEVSVGSGTGTKLIIEAGASLKFNENSHITIAYSSSNFAMIEAIGTATEPIHFTSSSANPSKGDWNSITFYDGSSSGSVFDYCNFSDGGGYSGAPAMIVFKYQQGSTTTIKNSSFSNSAGYGIMLDQVNTDSNYPSLLNNTFSNNTLGDMNW